MSNYLTWPEVQPHVPDKPETTNVEHCKTGRGNDKMYVTLKPDGTVLAYCHHCGKGGKFRAKTGRATSNGGQMKFSKDNVTFPHSSEWNMDLWHVDAVKWVAKYGIKREELETNKIAYDRNRHAVLLPCIHDGVIQVIQSRTLDTSSGKAKYYTDAKRDAKAWFQSEGTGSTLVLTEDILSAIKVARVTASIALLGTSIKRDLLLHLTTEVCPDNIVVWLDDDNPQVRVNQYQVAKECELFCPTRIIRGKAQPKELSVAEIKEVLDEVGLD